MPDTRIDHTSLYLSVFLQPECERYDYIKNYADSITDGFGLAMILSILPDEKQRYNFAMSQHEKIDGFSLGYVLSKLGKSYQFEFAVCLRYKIKDNHQLANVLDNLKREDRKSFHDIYDLDSKTNTAEIKCHARLFPRPTYRAPVPGLKHKASISMA